LPGLFSDDFFFFCVLMSILKSMGDRTFLGFHQEVRIVCRNPFPPPPLFDLSTRLENLP